MRLDLRSALLEQGNEFSELNSDRLREARDYFYSTLFFGEENYGSVIEGNYECFDLNKWGRDHLGFDCLKFLKVLIGILQAGFRPRRVLFLGCGPGRLFASYLVLLKAVGVQEVTFNDYLNIHLEKARDSLNSLLKTYDSNNPIKINWVPGDCLKEDLLGSYDLIFSQWYVTSEIFTFGLGEILSSSRVALGERIRDLLNQDGFFAEEVPDIDTPGTFYQIARAKTEIILEESGLDRVLSQEIKNLLLSYFGTASGMTEQVLPYHVRYTPKLEIWKERRRQCGLDLFSIPYRGPLLVCEDSEKCSEEFVLDLVKNRTSILQGEVPAFQPLFRDIQRILTLKPQRIGFAKWQLLALWRFSGQR